MVNAAFGVTKSLIQMLSHDQPSHMVIACDAGTDTFRKELYEDYKSNRDRMPDDLSGQLDIIWKAIELLKIPLEVMPGFEADDIVGSLSTQYDSDDRLDEIRIISSDKDLYQFINKKTRVYDAMKKRLYDTEAAFEKFGVEPQYIVDYLAIVGDTSDCIPGVRGVWPKGAQALINAYGTLEEIYGNIDNITGRTQVLMQDAKSLAFLSKDLATIKVDLKLQHDIYAYDMTETHQNMYTPEFVEFLEKNEFNSLIPEDLRKPKEELPEYVIKDFNLEQNFKDFFVENKEKPLTLRTTGDRFTLKDMWIVMDNICYNFPLSHPRLGDFISELFSSDMQVQGYHLKEDIRRMKFYLEDTSVLRESQGSLF